MRYLLLLLLVLAPLRAEAPSDAQISLLTDLGAYSLVSKLAEATHASMPAQSLAGMARLPAEQRWMLPVAALPLLMSARLSVGKESFALADQLTAEAQALKLDEQELALRVLTLRICHHADLPKELLRRLPAARELSARVVGTRGKILAFQVASYEFLYTHSPRAPKEWQDGYLAARALLPTEMSVPPNSFGLWLGMSECLYNWMLMGLAAGAPDAYIEAMTPEIRYLTQICQVGLQSRPSTVEPLLATIWLGLRTSTDAPTLESSWQLVQQLRPVYDTLEKQLAPQKLTCLDEMRGLESCYYLNRISLKQEKPGDLDKARDAVLLYGAPPAILELLTVISERDPATADKAVQTYLQLPQLTRVQRSALLTLSARGKLAQKNEQEARALLFEARTLQLDYLAERQASTELDQLYFGPTLALMKQLKMAF